MTRRARTRLAPGGSAIPVASLVRALTASDGASALDHALRTRFAGATPTYHASGREAMRVVLARLAERSGRCEIAIPAYACFSIPASVVAAGLRVRLVDVDANGRLAPEAIARIPFERVAAVVVGNLFGVPEPVAALAAQARRAGAAVVDDAAQALGATAEDGIVGARGDVGILSFGRGKPLSALGGGAAIWSAGRPDAPVDPSAAGSASAPGKALAPASPGATGRLAACLRGLAYDLSRRPAVLGLLARIPALEIGRTIYDTDFARGAMPQAALALAGALAPELDRLNAARRTVAHALAARICEATEYRPLLEGPDEVGVFPRLGVLAPSRERRDRALAALLPLGATAMYPTPLDAIRALEPHRIDSEACPGAKSFCDRLLTLPTHADLGPARAEAVVRILARG